MAKLNKIEVLIVEDDLISAAYLKSIIEENSDFKVIKILTNSKDVLHFLKNTKVNLIFMDIVLKGSLSGAELALIIKDRYKEIEIIFLTAYFEDEMIEYAIESKAFAYLLKPYREGEIKATLKLIKAKICNKDSKKSSSILKLTDGYYYDFDLKRLCKDKKEVELTPLELKLIQILCENFNITISKETLLDRLNIKENALRALIYRIRKETSFDLIQSIKRFGYKINSIY